MFFCPQPLISLGHVQSTIVSMKIDPQSCSHDLHLTSASECIPSLQPLFKRLGGVKGPYSEPLLNNWNDFLNQTTIWDRQKIPTYHGCIINEIKISGKHRHMMALLMMLKHFVLLTIFQFASSGNIQHSRAQMQVTESKGHSNCRNFMQFLSWKLYTVRISPLAGN